MSYNFVRLLLAKIFSTRTFFNHDWVNTAPHSILHLNFIAERKQEIRENNFEIDLKNSESLH